MVTSAKVYRAEQPKRRTKELLGKKIYSFLDLRKIRMDMIILLDKLKFSRISNFLSFL